MKQGKAETKIAAKLSSENVGLWMEVKGFGIWSRDNKGALKFHEFSSGCKIQKLHSQIYEGFHYMQRWANGKLLQRKKPSKCCLWKKYEKCLKSN